MIYIYKLEDPRKPGVIRYIGKTTGSLANRLYGHIQDMKRPNHRTNWIKSLLAVGVKPVIMPLFQFDGSEADWRLVEPIFMRLVRDAGHPLTNGHPGGNGQDVGYEATKEARRKISAAHKGKPKSPQHVASFRKRMQNRPPEEIEKWRAATSAAHTGRVKSPEEREKIRLGNTGKKQSPEQIEKRVAHLRGKPISQKQRDALRASHVGVPQSDEQRAQLSARMKGTKQSDETKAKRSASLKAYYAANPMSDEDRQRRSDWNKGNRNCLGRVLSEESKAKMRASALLREARKRKAKQVTRS